MDMETSPTNSETGSETPNESFNAWQQKMSMQKIVPVEENWQVSVVPLED